MAILWLGEPACNDPVQAGGKAASLSCLAPRYRIPPGFCIPAGDCRRWLVSENPPAELVDSVTVAYARLTERCGSVATPVAVRSSAADEDGAAASFAGQYESILNVTSADAVVHAILRCLASAASPQVISYRHQRGLPTVNVPVAVLVQQLVIADVAAVVFSVNPITGDSREIVINASWGLGESLVGGSVTPDSYVVSRADWAVASRSLARKLLMTVPVAGGTCEAEVPSSMQDAATLDDRQVIELAQLATSLEATIGRPVDIECAYQTGELFLLQCRPITALGTSLAAAR